MKIQSFYRANSYTRGYNGKIPVFSTPIIEDSHEWNWDKTNLIILENGQKYLSTDLVTTLGPKPTVCEGYISVGRRTFYNFERNFDLIFNHIEYERRNDIERAVQARNRAIFELIVDL